MTKKKSIIMLLCGILGCICFGCGDRLMIYGDVTHNGSLYWLTNGTAQIPERRNSLSMLLSFAGIIFYGIALFSISDFIRENRQKKIYKTLTSFGLTPWLSLHLFYIMILFLFSWLNGNGYADVAMPACEALVQTFVMDSIPQRSIYACAVYIMVLSANQKKDGIPKSRSVYKYTYYIRCNVYNKNGITRIAVPFRLYKQTYERKYGNLVCNCFYLGRKMF